MTKKKAMIKPTVPYNINGDQLDEVELNQRFSWTKHIETTANKANGTLKFLRRNMRRCSTATRSKAYLSLVRPIMEYAAAAWDPKAKKSVEKLDSVQKRAAKFTHVL